MKSKINVTLRAGSSYKNWGGSVHNAIDIQVHENFSTDTLDYDIAVVKVKDCRRHRDELSLKKAQSIFQLIFHQ